MIMLKGKAGYKIKWKQIFLKSKNRQETLWKETHEKVCNGHLIPGDTKDFFSSTFLFFSLHLSY